MQLSLSPLADKIVLRQVRKRSIGRRLDGGDTLRNSRLI